MIGIYEQVLGAEKRVALAAALHKREQGNWYPACSGTETPFMTRTGMRLQYMYQPSTGNHAYINCDTDIILSDDDAMIALGVF